jgi:hypothetical protein
MICYATEEGEDKPQITISPTQDESTAALTPELGSYIENQMAIKSLLRKRGRQDLAAGRMRGGRRALSPAPCAS